MSTVSRQQILGLAVILAALTTFVAYRTFFLRAGALTPGAAATAPSGPRRVAVANRDIQPLELLDRGMFRLVPASDQAPRDAVTSLEAFDGQIATNFIAKNEPVKGTDVAYPDAKFGMAFQVPAGSRAITVPVNPVSGLAGFLQPGNRVDVLATFDTRGEAVTRTVVQDVVILAYGRNIRAEEPAEKAETKEEQETQPADTATLLVAPAQAERLALAAAKARLSLALRGIKEDAPLVRTAGVMEHQITRVPATARPAPPAPERPQPAPEQRAGSPVVAARSPEPKPEPPDFRSIVVIRGTRQEIVQVPR